MICHLIDIIVCCQLLLSVAYGLRTVTNQEENSRFWEKAAQVQGPNICASERIPGSQRRFGRPWTGGQVCGQPSVVVFECCQGYDFIPGEPGCAVVKRLSTIWDKVNQLKVAPLVELVQTSGLTVALSNEGPYTLFVPVFQAFENLTEDVSQTLNRTTSRSSRRTPSALLYHVVEGRFGERDFEDNMLITTLYHRLPLRLNKFPNGLLTVNCIPLVKLNQEATNGMIHTVGDVLIPPAQRTIAEVLRDIQFSRFSNALIKAKLTSLLMDQQRTFTVFAPTNDAFDNLTREDFEAIFADHEALTALLRYHIVTDVWCSSSIVSQSTLVTLEGSSLLVSCNHSGTYVNDANLVKRDIMTINGLIHLVDKVLFPTRAKSLLQLLDNLKLTEFSSLIPVSGLTNMFVNGAKFTVFAPSNRAFEALPDKTLFDLRLDPPRCYDFLVAHMVIGKYRTSNFVDKQLLPTLAQMRPLQVDIYPQKILVDGGVIGIPNIEGRNGVVHVIDQVIFSPNLTIGQFILEHVNLSVFCNALNNTTTDLLKELNDSVGPFTVFAPDDEAFDRLPPFTLDRMLMEPEILTRIMTNHVLDEHIFTTGLLPKAYYHYETRHSGIMLKIREDTGLVTAGIAIVKEADILCTNGVLHIVDRLIQTEF